MTLSNPSLELYFTGADIGSHDIRQTISSAYILSRSVTLKKQLLNGLEASSNTVPLSLSKNCPSIEDIIATDGNIEATFKDGDTTIFTGYLSTDFSWSVSASGEAALSVTLEDVGTRLFKKDFIESGYNTFNCSVENAVKAICTKAGVTIDSSAVFPSGAVIKCVEGENTCKDLLQSLLKEFNCVYYFNNLGKLCIFDVSADQATKPEFTDSNLYENISVSKKIRQYRNAKVSFTETGTADNYLIYRNTTQDADGGKTCYLQLPAGYHYDGTEKYYPESGSTRSPAYIEACNAASETSIVGGREIIAVSNLSPSVSILGNLSATVTASGSKYFTLDAVNCGSTTGYFRQLDVIGSIIYEKNESVVRTGETLSGEVIEEELTWSHDKSVATKHANLLAQYYTYAGTEYTFCSTQVVALGTVCRLHEANLSDLDVDVLVYASTETDESGVIQYNAVGYSQFNLEKDVSESVVVPGGAMGSIKGEQGEQGEKGDPGDPATVKTIQLVSSASAITRNDRLSSFVTYLFTAVVENYDTTTLQWYKDGELTNTTGAIFSDELAFKGATSHTYKVVVPEDDNYDEITLSVVDETPSVEFLGLQSSEVPVATKSGMNLINGDWFFALTTFDTYIKGRLYQRVESTWEELTSGTATASQYMQTLKALKNNGYSLSDYSDSNAVTYMQTLVTEQLFVDQIKASDGFFDNITIGQSATFNGEINGDAIKTIKATSGDGSGATVANNPVAWSTDDLSITENSILSYSGTFGSASFSQIVNVTDPTTVIFEGYTSTTGLPLEYSTFSATLFTATAHCSFTISGKNTYYYGPNGDPCIYVNGTLVAGENNNLEWFYFSGDRFEHSHYKYETVNPISLNTGDVVTFKTVRQRDYHTSSGYVTIVVSSSTLADAGLTDGKYIYLSTGWTHLKGKYTDTLVCSSLGINTSSSTYLKYNNVNNFVNYAPSGLTAGMFRLQQISNAVYVNGSWKTPELAVKGTNQTTLVFTDDSQVVLKLNEYAQVYGTIKSDGYPTGIEMKGQYPMEDDTYSMGTSAKYWKEAYINTVYGSAIGTSARKYKTDIANYGGDALQIINDTQVVSFHFKRDIERLEKGQITEAQLIDNIGFIADDTDPAMSGKNKDCIITNNCIGVLIKGIQQLYAKVEELEKKLEQS